MNIGARGLLAVAGCCGFFTDPATHAQVVQQKCGWLDSAWAGPYQVQNDVWGPVQNKEKARFPKKFVQCIDGYKFKIGRASASFHWSIRNSGDVVSYPHVQFDFDGKGGRPGPISIGTLRERSDISAFSGYALRSSGTYNVSYDIWLTSTDAQNTTRIIELMIWLDTDMHQNTPSTGSVVVDGNHYEIYRKFQGDPGKAWEYIALVADHKINDKRISISKISLQLVVKGVLHTNDMISGVQFGAEISGGDGALTINNFDIANGF